MIETVAGVRRQLSGFFIIYLIIRALIVARPTRFYSSSITRVTK